jgi:hypothetical protein
MRIDIEKETADKDSLSNEPKQLAVRVATPTQRYTQTYTYVSIHRKSNWQRQMTTQRKKSLVYSSKNFSSFTNVFFIHSFPLNIVTSLTIRTIKKKRE